MPFTFSIGGAETDQRAFGVIARGNRLANDGRTFGVKPCQQNRGFHLRAGNGSCVVNCVEFAAANFERSASAFLAFDFGAHLAQRLDHAAHGTAAERIVSRDAGGKRLTGENTGQHADG